MRTIFTLFSFLVLFSSSVFAQSATLVQKALLPTPTLDEISGIIHWNGKLYGHEDSGNTPTIYEIDSTSGAITKTITLGGATNVDWEDLTQDETHIYIGDFGNNFGDRKNLKFYKFPKQAITDITGSSGTIPAGEVETINFNYENQVAFCSDNGGTCTDRNTNFDCEAVLYTDGKLHLFTKNWITAYTVHYTLPITAGTFVAEKKDSLDTQGLLITGAAKMNNKIVTLLGYNNPYINPTNTHCGVWLVTGFTDMNNLFTGVESQKQKIDLGLFATFPFSASKGQVEGLTAVSQTRVLVSSERFTTTYMSIPIDLPANLYGLNLDNFISQELLPAGITNFTSHLSDNQVSLSWQYEDAGASYFEVEVSVTGNSDDFTLAGKVDANNTYPATFNFTDNGALMQGVKYYRIKIITLDGQTYYSKILPVKKNGDKQFSLSAAPSPFADKLNISFFSDTQQTVQLSIVDIYGRTVQTHQLKCQTGKYSYSMDGLIRLSKGVYFLTGRTKNNLFVRRILKQ